MKIGNRPQISVTGASLLAGLLSGCANTPSPNYVGHDGESTGVTVDQLVHHIECEIILAKRFNELAAQNYLAQVTLTLKVEDNAALTPTLSFINPLVLGESVAYGVGGTLSLDRQMTFTALYTISLKSLADPNIPNPLICDDSNNKITYNLTGDLGISGIIQSGLDTAAYTRFNAPSQPSTSPATSYDVIADPKVPRNDHPNYRVSPATTPPKQKAPPGPPSFGSTTQFTIVKSANAGPTWTLIHFKGPSGSTGLINAGRTDTDTLILAFAPGAKPPSLAVPHGETAEAKALRETSAAAAANAEDSRAQGQVQTLTTNILLQNLSAIQSTPH